MHRPFIIAVCGFTGVGKSFVANLLKEKLDCVILRSDVIRKELAGIDLSTHVYDDFEKGIYSKEMTERVYTELFERAKLALKNSKNVILDATFLDKEKRDRLRALAKALDVKLFILWIEAPSLLIKKRLEKRKSDVSDGRWEIYLKQIEKYKKPTEEEDIIYVKNDSKIYKRIEDLLTLFFAF
ncbi:MAG: AAA family ATPase [Candidatus Hydrothermales bacterium]